MRSPLNRWIGKLAVGSFVASAALAALVAPAAEAATVVPCTTRSTITPFKSWNDTNAYFTAPGGSFEGGATGWTLGNASVVSGNEPWKILAGTDATSLKISGGGTASTQPMCIATAEDSMRVFYKAPVDSGSRLKITIHVTSGVNVADNNYEIWGGNSNWALSERIMLPDIRDASGKQTVTISFAQTGNAGIWQIDDLEIDPWRSL